MNQEVEESGRVLLDKLSLSLLLAIFPSRSDNGSIWNRKKGVEKMAEFVALRQVSSGRYEPYLAGGSPDELEEELKVEIQQTSGLKYEDLESRFQIHDRYLLLRIYEKASGSMKASFHVFKVPTVTDRMFANIAADRGKKKKRA